MELRTRRLDRMTLQHGVAVRRERWRRRYCRGCRLGSDAGWTCGSTRGFPVRQIERFRISCKVMEHDQSNRSNERYTGERGRGIKRERERERREDVDSRQNGQDTAELNESSDGLTG